MTSIARHIAKAPVNTWQLISKGTLDPDDTAVSDLELTWTEDFERIEFIGCLRPVSNNINLRLRFSSDGSTFVSTTTYKTGAARHRQGTGTDAFSNNGANAVQVAQDAGNTQWESVYTIITLDGITQRSDDPVGQFQTRYQDHAGVERCYVGGFRETSLSDIKGIRLDFASGDIDSYNYVLRGQL